MSGMRHVESLQDNMAPKNTGISLCEVSQISKKKHLNISIQMIEKAPNEEYSFQLSVVAVNTR